VERRAFLSAITGGLLAAPLAAEARLAVFDYIEGWYNSRRRPSALDYLSPVAHEKRELERA